MDEVTVLRAGLLLERTGASVLSFKQGASRNTSVVLCLWPTSYHPFVVWTYNELNGVCEQGDYFMDLQEALDRFNERGW
jgi:hypothetical protein